MKMYSHCEFFQDPSIPYQTTFLFSILFSIPTSEQTGTACFPSHKCVLSLSFCQAPSNHSLAQNRFLHPFIPPPANFMSQSLAINHLLFVIQMCRIWFVISAMHLSVAVFSKLDPICALIPPDQATVLHPFYPSSPYKLHHLTVSC